MTKPIDEKIRFVIGCMTGTSIDGLDASMIRIDGCGLDMRISVVDSQSFELPNDLQDKLRACAAQAKMSAGEFGTLSLQFGEFHATCLNNFAKQFDRVDLVSVHGQTVFHDPPVSKQLINVHPIACELVSPVVFDLRGADLAAGGQGAPITPIVDAMLFADIEESVAIVNLGGFANYTRLPHIDRANLASELHKVEAEDICVCNQLLDRAARELLGEPIDREGAIAARGTVCEEAAEELTNFLHLQSTSQRSLGTGDEYSDWMERWRNRLGVDDLLRTICHSIGLTIRMKVASVDRIFCAGGGVKNKVLLADVRGSLIEHESKVNSSNREAVAMAVLGALCQDGVQITFPHVTGLKYGCAAPIAGAWVYPPNRKCLEV